MYCYILPLPDPGNPLVLLQHMVPTFITNRFALKEPCTGSANQECLQLLGRRRFFVNLADCLCLIVVELGLLRFDIWATQGSKD